ncbi:LysR family transcriptional regulator [Nocardia sp. CA2R105]|uniref:LysR family transcriptional regulator n=1 Tax=Nocardia coffeae TaxID=2873381 RepID=UPI001CA75BB6|nr:LysR family transcriptional regulator [Nocardia coffeae]MBY8857160.1 LysR family transcriptional regulator [Nocardia coffeae]
MYDPRQLQVLVEVARSGTFTAAADALGYTQPAVSYQMRTLERAVGAPLTSRYGRRVRLTPVGAALARHAETVLATLRTAQNELASLVSEGGGQVRMSAFQSGCVGLVPSALARLRRTHPELEVVLTQTECAISHRLVLSGEVDLAVVCDLDDAENPPDPRLQRIPLLSDHRCVLLPADHPAANAASVSLDELAGERWILETVRTRFLAACREAGFTPRIAATSDDQLTIHSLVAHRIGLAIMNELGIAAHTHPQVVARPLRGWPTRHIYAMLWPDLLKSAQVSAMLSALGSAASALGLGAAVEVSGDSAQPDRDC